MSTEANYDKNFTRLKIELGKMIDNCLQIVGSDLDKDMPDDKMHNVIKSKKMAAETVIWATQEIDRLEKELNGDNEQPQKIQNYAERLAK